jgi:hypothetical protein
MGEELEALRALEKYAVNIETCDEYYNRVYKIYESGGIAAALRLISELEAQSEEPDLRLLSILYTLSGDIEKALDQIEYNARNYVTEFTYVYVEPIFKRLRSEPRFQAVVCDLGYDK